MLDVEEWRACNFQSTLITQGGSCSHILQLPYQTKKGKKMTLRETMALLISEGVELKSNDGNVGFKIKNADTSIVDVDMPNRGRNALFRNGARTVGDVVDLFNSGSGKMKGVGDKTLRETKQALIEWNWSMMTQMEQREYLKTLFV